MRLYDRMKKADPTPKEQAHWEELAAAECERQRKLRKEQAEGRRTDTATQQRMRQQFRS